ncbi:MAG: MFS transporter [Firmicutes bacterium]|nr:MFS transporter [Bacillota bacterium]
MLWWPRDLVPPLGRRAWWLLAGYALEKLGSGLIWPFLVVYMHEVRGIDLATAGLVLSAASVAGVIAVPVSGELVDRIGAGRTVAITVVLGAAGTVGFASMNGPVWAFVAGCLYGGGTSSMWNVFAALLAEAVPPARRSGVFGMAFGLQNLGFGLGAAAGGLIVDIHVPASFTPLFLATTTLYLLFVTLLIARGETRRQSPAAPPPAAPGVEKTPAPSGAGAVRRGYHAVFADRALIGTAILNALTAVVMVALYDVAFPAWATGPARSSTQVVGFAFTANSVVIVVVQLFVLRYLLEGRRRTRMSAVAALIFGAACLLTLIAGKAGGGAFTTAGLIGALGIFGFGNALLQPSLYALVNDLAPDQLRGRYNAFFNLSFQAGSVAGPAVAGAALARGMYGTLFVGLAVTCGFGALLGLWLERVIPAAANLTFARPKVGRTENRAEG